MLSDLVSTEKYLDAARVPEDVFGAIGVLSGGRIVRQRCTEDAVELAFLGSEKPEERWTIYR